MVAPRQDPTRSPTSTATSTSTTIGAHGTRMRKRLWPRRHVVQELKLLTGIDGRCCACPGGGCRTRRRNGTDGSRSAQLGTLPVIEGTVIHLRVDRLPSGATPKPVWLWWSGTDATTAQVDLLWQAFLRRFDIEHTFRFFKQTLGWTCPKIRTPESADRWTWLILAVYAQLRLARPLAADLRRPWERPSEPHRLTPARVRRDFRHLRPKAACPARAPKFTSPGPGRPPGRKNTRPTPRHDVHTVRKTGTNKPRAKKPTTPRPHRKG